MDRDVLDQEGLDLEEQAEEVWEAAYYEPTNSACSTQTKFTGHVVTSPESRASRCDKHDRVIIHIDLDCFYAQVEMLEKPALRNKPLGVQQKSLMVTSNYMARTRGVPKYCRVQEALRVCPELVLVNGEDLTRYRQVSYKVTEFFQQYTELVERLGFDENFLDVTSLLGSPQWRHLKEKSRTDGHIYGAEANDAEDVPCSCGCHGNLVAGSHLAAHIRRSLFAELGLTCCAGVAHNKLLAKLVGGANKPNQQTTVFPGKAGQLIQSLGHIRKLPGIGMSISKRLEALGISTIVDLQRSETLRLREEFSGEQITWLHNLAQGIDLQDVQKTKPPQSMSDEDSFKKCASATEACTKIGTLLLAVLHRVLCDGRTPAVLRVTVRKVVEDQQKRESRQCPIPSNIFRGFSQGTIDVTRSSLMLLADKLFKKLVDITQPFHLTLINVCVTKFSDNSSPSNNISRFLQASASRKSGGPSGMSASVTVGNVATGTQPPSSEHTVVHGKRDRNGNIIKKSGLDRYFLPKQLTFVKNQETSSAQEIRSREEKPLGWVGSSRDWYVCSNSSEREMPQSHAAVKHCTERVVHQTNCTDLHGYHDDGENPKEQRMDVSVRESPRNSRPSVVGPREAATIDQRTRVSQQDDNDKTPSARGSPDSVTMATRALDNLPPGVDPAIFSQLPSDLQADVLAQYRTMSGRTGGGANGEQCGADTGSVKLQSPKVISRRTRPWFTDSATLEEQFRNKREHDGEFLKSQHPSVTGSVGHQFCETPALTVDCERRTTRVPLNVHSDSHVSGPSMNKSSGSSPAVEECCPVERPRGPPGRGHEDHTQCPDNIDPETFSQLPSDIQRELFLEWKREKTSLCVAKSGCHSSKGKLKSPKTLPLKTSITKYFISPNRSNNADRK